MCVWGTEVCDVNSSVIGEKMLSSSDVIVFYCSRRINRF